MLLSSWETVPKPAAKTLSADERNVLRGRLAALLDENNELLRELACTWSDALQRALYGAKGKSKENLACIRTAKWPCSCPARLVHKLPDNWRHAIDRAERHPRWLSGVKGRVMLFRTTRRADQFAE